VLLAFLRADLVDRLGWLTESQLIDAIAVGQITPGPVLSTATFLGYLLAGPKGALLATVGIFAPAFVLVALSGPLIPVVRRVPVLASFLDGVNVASWVLMVFVALQLGRAALGDLPALGLFALSVLLLLRFRTHTTWLLVCGAGLGWLLHQLGLSSR
jgi:chromate transporter